MFVDSPTQNPASLEFLSSALMRQQQTQPSSSIQNQSKYAQLLAVIEEMGMSVTFI